MDQGYEKSTPDLKVRVGTLKLAGWKDDGDALSSRDTSQEAADEST
jgi:hypothetical protein